MKTFRITAVLLALLLANISTAQTAQQVLDKAAAIIVRKGGASANFSVSGAKYGSTSGSIAIKGKKFFASTPEAKVWFDGKTQWSYMKNTEEVNISTPTQAAQMSMNPYTFVSIYKTGYTTTMKTVNGNYEIHLVAQNQKRTVQELYITVSKSYILRQIKMRQGKSWTTINVSNFKGKDQNDAIFRFPSKDYPHAEVIDLR